MVDSVMIKRLVAHGNTVALVLDPAKLDALGVEKGAEVELRLDHGRLIVEPVARRKRFESAMALSFQKHDKTFKALAK